MLKDPQSAKKSQTQFINQSKFKLEFIDLLKVGTGNMLGEEDVAEPNRLHYSVSVKCVSHTGVIYAIQRN